MAAKNKGSKGFKTGGSKQQWAVDDKPLKVDNYDGSAVKNALDDAVKQVFVEKHGYTESHSLMDGRLVICTVSVGFALCALAWDYLNPFPKSRPVLIICVLSYFFMMGILTLYTTFKERGCFLVALDKDQSGIDPDKIWNMASQMKRYDDMYHLHATFKDPKAHTVRTGSFSKSVANFFDENGYLCRDLFEAEVEELHRTLSTEKKTK